MTSSVANQVCVVTGSSGFVGRRLVEMLVERGAKRVVALDIREPSSKRDASLNFLTPEQETKVSYVLGDISDPDVVMRALQGADCVFHIAAAVGPYPKHELFHKVNVVGTQNVVDACRAHRVRKLVAASTPSIFFDGNNISGKRPAELQIRKPGEFLAAYAETKAVAERIVREANRPPELYTVNIAPHQVYGERDSLFLPNFLAAKDSLRIFGSGQNLVSFTYVDNYAHGLILGLDALYDGSPALGKFYLVTDGPAQNLWHSLDRAVRRVGGVSLVDRAHLPLWLLYTVAYVGKVVGWFLGKQFRITPFNVTMMSIDRYFDISDAVRDLKYAPLVEFDSAWDKTIDWFKAHEPFWRANAVASLSGQADKRV